MQSDAQEGQRERKSLNVQGYLDVCLFADLVRAVSQSRARKLPPSYSAYVREILEAVHRSLKAEHFESPDEALAYLASEGFSIAQLGSKKRGRSLRVDLREEDLRGDGPGPRPPSERASEISQLFADEEAQNEGA